MNLKISLTSAEPFSSVKQYQQRWEIVTALANSVQFGLKHWELFLYVKRVFKPLTGQCTGMAPICIKRDLSHDGVWCGRGVGVRVTAIMTR